MRRALAACLAAACVAAAVLASGCAPDRPARTGEGAGRATAAPAETEAAWSALGLLSGACSEQIRETLAAWGAGPVALEAPPGPTGRTVLRLPTSELGRWVVAERGAAAPVLHLVDPSGTLTRSLSATCAPSDRRTEGRPEGGTERRTEGGTERRTGEPARRGPAGGSPFTDADLLAALREAGDGGLVVYAWSPHMPLSVDGWAELAAAAGARGLGAIPVLIAHGDEDFARREASRAGIPAEGLRPVASIELIMRDLQVHAPSILVFRAGRVSPVLPGYRNADGYGRFLDAFEAGG